MTADAKVGLLLGLFFIVIIAFLVNGLPNFIHEEDTSPASATIIAHTGQDMVLDNSVPEAAHRLYPSRATVQRATQPPQEMVVLDSPPEQVLQVEIPDLVPQRQTPVAVQEVAKASEVQTHIVKPGENLAVIAKLFYGEVQGNRKIVIRKLYEANAGVLKSADRVCVGQKLVGPLSHEDLLDTSSGVAKAPSPSEGLLSKFPAMLKWVDKKDAGSISEYTVREGDSLWSIAQQNLGDGNRYKEIFRMNKGKIKRVNDVVIGTRLKIPTQ